MRIEVFQDDLEMKINKLTPLTTELFDVYSKHFNRSNSKELADIGGGPKKKEVSDETGSELDKESINQSKQQPTRNESESVYSEDVGIPFRAPNNTTLFLKWLESDGISAFRTIDFVRAYPQITEEAADKIILYQLQQGNLQQIGKDRFVARARKVKE